MFFIAKFFADVHAAGPSCVVVTNGADGVYISDKKTIYFHPSVHTQPISTVGAGDAFCSTFIAHLLQANSLEDACRMGIINSANVIGHVGAQTGLLTTKELDEQFSLFDKKLMQKYPLIL